MKKINDIKSRIKQMTTNVEKQILAYCELHDQIENEAMQAAMMNAENDFQLGCMMGAMMWNRYPML